MFHFAPAACSTLPTPCYCGPYCRLAEHHDHHLLASGTACALMLVVLCSCERPQKKPDPSFGTVYTAPGKASAPDDSCLDDAPSSGCN